MPCWYFRCIPKPLKDAPHTKHLMRGWDRYASTCPSVVNGCWRGIGFTQQLQPRAASGAAVCSPLHFASFRRLHCKGSQSHGIWSRARIPLPVKGEPLVESTSDAIDDVRVVRLDALQCDVAVHQRRAVVDAVGPPRDLGESFDEFARTYAIGFGKTVSSVHLRYIVAIGHRQGGSRSCITLMAWAPLV